MSHTTTTIERIQNIETTPIQLDSRGKISLAYLKRVFDTVIEQAREVYADRKDVLNILEPHTARVELNGRLKTCAGRAHCLNGTLNYGRVEISTKIFSHPSVNAAQLVETIRHEVAHLIAQYRAAHGPVWVAAYQRIGGNGEKYHDMTQAAAAARPKRIEAKLACGTCSKGIGSLRRRGKGYIISWASKRRTKCCGGRVVASDFQTIA